jgi:NitT/TauT family transport system permease protein
VTGKLIPGARNSRIRHSPFPDDSVPTGADAPASRPGRRIRARQRDLALGVATPVILVAAWQASASLGLIDARIFTPPAQIAATAWNLITAGTLPHDLGVTLLRLVTGYLTGAVGGTAAGMLLGLSRPLRAAFSPLLTALYARKSRCCRCCW